MIQDEKLIGKIRNNPNINNTDLAKEFGVSRQRISYRRKELEKAGVIPVGHPKQGRKSFTIQYAQAQNPMLPYMHDAISRAAAISIEDTILALQTSLSDLKERRRKILTVLSPAGGGVPGTSHNFVSEHILCVPLSKLNEANPENESKMNKNTYSQVNTTILPVGIGKYLLRDRNPKTPVCRFN